MWSTPIRAWSGWGKDIAEPDAVLQKYIGSTPFDWVGDETSLALGIAMYDLMGQSAEVPVYKLIGQKYRSWVPVASWTVSTHPGRMATAVQKFAELGYTWMKYHLSPFENVLDQMEAMQAVAPQGVQDPPRRDDGRDRRPRVRAARKDLEIRIAGCFEDPLPEKDIEGYVELRAEMPAADSVPSRAAGGRLRNPAPRRRRVHSRSLPHRRRDSPGRSVREARDSLFTAKRRRNDHPRHDGPHAGGVQIRLVAFQQRHRNVERGRRKRTARAGQRPDSRFRKPGWGSRSILRSSTGSRISSCRSNPAGSSAPLQNGTTMYNLADPRDSLFLVRPDKRREVTLSYDSPIATDYWDPDGTPEFQAMFRRLETEGVVLERR